jgi:hypothetical protein
MDLPIQFDTRPYHDQLWQEFQRNGFMFRFREKKETKYRRYRENVRRNKTQSASS